MRFLFFYLTVLATAFSTERAAAQCDRTGWVAGVIPGCGVKIIDLDEGEIIKAVSGASNLKIGQTISFSAVKVKTPSACTPDALQTVALTCLSDTLPCKADFNFTVDPENAFRFLFEADVSDPNTQKCNWKFSDGSTASGRSIQHVFPYEGYFDVCLTITDPFGCAVQRCKQVYVSHQNPNWCDYDVYVTAVREKVYGKLVPLSGAAAPISEVKWYINKTGQVLGHEPSMNADLPGKGTYLICAQYSVKTPGGKTCTTVRCKSITTAPLACVSPLLTDDKKVCPAVYAPVCGCNETTYGNECEAIMAGLTKWWPGECATGNNICSCDLETNILNGTPDGGYYVRFTNLAQGDYTNLQLDFGDGSPIHEGANWDTIVHYYAKGGIYRSNLTAWKNGGCISSVVKILSTDAYSTSAKKAPGSTDYVYPGDANSDKVADMYDLLEIGAAYFSLGAPRPFASSNWTPQFSPNWLEKTGAGINLKHADCDGSGMINEFDIAPIEQHYQALDTVSLAFNPDLPQIWMSFPEDTVYINPGKAGYLEINADIMVGSAAKPVKDIYGLAFSLRYPDFFDPEPSANYDDNSFFGFTNHILWLPRDNHERRQFDLGFTRKNGKNTSGYGRIANISLKSGYVIIVDVADRTKNPDIPVVIPISGVKAKDANGKEFALSAPAQLDTLWVKVRQTSAVKKKDVDRFIELSPNPAETAVTLLFNDLKAAYITVSNALGQTCARITVPENAGNTFSLPLINWEKGVYFLQIATDKGIAQKRLVVR